MPTSVNYVKLWLMDYDLMIINSIKARVLGGVGC